MLQPRYLRKLSERYPNLSLSFWGKAFQSSPFGLKWCQGAQTQMLLEDLEDNFAALLRFSEINDVTNCVGNFVQIRYND